MHIWVIWWQPEMKHDFEWRQARTLNAGWREILSDDWSILNNQIRIFYHWYAHRVLVTFSNSSYNCEWVKIYNFLLKNSAPKKCMANFVLEIICSTDCLVHLEKKPFFIYWDILMRLSKVGMLDHFLYYRRWNFFELLNDAEISRINLT